MKDARPGEVDEKIERVARLARESGVRGILISLQPGFSWLTGGRTNRIDGSREPGAGALLVTADARRFVVANNIESPRLAQEVVAGLDFEVVAFPWVEERADPSLPVRTAARTAGGKVGTDTPAPDAPFMEPAIARLRAPLVHDEIARYRNLGADAGRALGDVMAAVRPGSSEKEVVNTVAAALAAKGLRPIVLLAAGDHRIARFRHPVPTDLRWTDRLLVGTCAERDGLVVALSRLVAVRADADLERRTRAAASAFAALLEATTGSASGAHMFAAAAAAYAAAGYPGEEGHHHQGGAIGYRAREWVAHPASQDVASLPQAFAWNPTVAGTKIEETCLVHEDGRIDAITASPEWPTTTVRVRNQDVELPDVRVI